MPVRTCTSQVIAFPFHAVSAAGRIAPPRRPRLLVQAARAGQATWRRGRDLPRLMRQTGLSLDQRPPLEAGAPLAWLRIEEERHDNARRAAAAEYDLPRHVMLLIALLHEMTLVRQPSGAILPMAL